jgi:hypothetical protein
MWLRLPNSREFLRWDCGGIRTKRSLSGEVWWKNFTWHFRSRDKVRCEVSLMEDKEWES